MYKIKSSINYTHYRPDIAAIMFVRSQLTLINPINDTLLTTQIL